MHPRRIIALTAAAVAALIGLAGCGNPRTVHDQKSFSFHESRLVIDTESDLRVVPGNGPRIDVQRWLSGTPAEPGHSSWTLAGATLHLFVDCTGLVFHCGSRFQVAVPPRVSVEVRSGDNNDTVSGLTGPVVIYGGAGQVQLSDTSGPLRISTNAGSITGTAIRSAVVRATASAGNVSFTFAAAPQRVDISSSNGDATARVPVAGHRYHVAMTSGTGTASSRVPDDPHSGNTLHVSSGNGTATVLATP
ncbi:MAG: hypothetical protein ACRDOK_07780 [Streptosporangiaceae bacterium]